MIFKIFNWSNAGTDLAAGEGSGGLLLYQESIPLLLGWAKYGRRPREGLGGPGPQRGGSLSTSAEGFQYLTASPAAVKLTYLYQITKAFYFLG